MSVIERVECPTCNVPVPSPTNHGGHVKPDGMMCHGPVRSVEYVPAAQLRGAVEALQKIARGDYIDNTTNIGRRYYSPRSLRKIARDALDAIGGQ